MISVGRCPLSLLPERYRTACAVKLSPEETGLLVPNPKDRLFFHARSNTRFPESDR